MTDSRAAVGFDRLPWLTEEPKRPKDGARDLLGWAVAAMMLVAGASYWLGTQSGRDSEPAPLTVPAPKESTATVKLPEARTVKPAPEVPIAQPPEVRPAPQPPTVTIPEPKVERPVRRERSASARREKASPRRSAPKAASSKRVRKQAAAPSRPATSARSRAMPLWPSRQTRGAYGRIVQIGAFGSRQQAKLGWRRMTRAYPAVGRLPAVVVETRNSRGRRFYRFQIGTSSQAHSEVLCQWMQRIRFSCAVVGLPWKPRGVER